MGGSRILIAAASAIGMTLSLGGCGEGAGDPRGLPGGAGGSGGVVGAGGSGVVPGSGGTGGMPGTGGQPGTGGASGSAGTGGQPGTGGASGSAGTEGTGGTGGVACDQGPLGAPIPNCAPDLLPSTGDPREDCVRRINQLRWECQCLPPLQRWTAGESCADQHAEYDSTRSPHAGFSGGICSPGGWAQNECPGWNSTDRIIDVCLQWMWDEGPGEPYSEHGHYINMTNPGYSMVACGFYETGSGSIWAVQNFQ